MSKSIHLYEISDAMQIVLNAGGEVSFVTSGFSMLPLLRNHMDTAVLRKPTKPLKKGDVIFFRSDEKHFILHRIIKIKNGIITTRGDNQKQVETDISPEQVLAVLVRVVRKEGKKIECTGFGYRVYKSFLPFVRFFRLKVYPLYVRFLAPIYKKIKKQ